MNSHPTLNDVENSMVAVSSAADSAAKTLSRYAAHHGIDCKGKVGWLVTISDRASKYAADIEEKLAKAEERAKKIAEREAKREAARKAQIAKLTKQLEEAKAKLAELKSA